MTTAPDSGQIQGQADKQQLQKLQKIKSSAGCSQMPVMHRRHWVAMVWVNKYQLDLRVQASGELRAGSPVQCQARQAGEQCHQSQTPHYRRLCGCSNFCLLLIQALGMTLLLFAAILDKVLPFLTATRYNCCTCTLHWLPVETCFMHCAISCCHAQSCCKIRNIVTHGAMKTEYIQAC